MNSADSISVITIDGPTASGKGTVAQRVAEALHFHYLDSGALYRLTALSALRAKVALDDEQAIAQVAAGIHQSFFDVKFLLEGTDVSTDIRGEEVSNAASKIASLPAVRHALVDLQLRFCQAPGLIADGRDMGTEIFPDACLKVFLTASAEVRAKRRYKQLIDKGFSVRINGLLKDLNERDACDANRVVAPFKPAEGAYLLDTSNLTVNQAVEQVLGWYAALRKSA